MHKFDIISLTVSTVTREGIELPISILKLLHHLTPKNLTFGNRNIPIPLKPF